MSKTYPKPKRLFEISSILQLMLGACFAAHAARKTQLILSCVGNVENGFKLFVERHDGPT